MNQRNEIVNIKVSNLYPHPDNPRKDLGDLTELAESIQKSGIMQNLTVMPIDCTHEEKEKQSDPNNESLSSDFIVLIGHRRMAAAKKVGLEKVPCMIVSNISKKEQISIMLEENMQRNDLTIYEQAQGFQMMLDLGETEESIAEKTGFSRTTIRRRLNIAKLDQEELKKKEQNESFQLTLKDLYVLEELKDVEERNKILREATNSLVLQSKVSQRKAELTREENAKKLIKELEEMGVTKAPEEYLGSMYSGKWTTVKNISLDETTPKIPHIKEVEGCFYYKSFRSIQVFRKNTKTEKTETEYERKRKEEDRKKTEIQNIAKEMEMQRADFIRNLLCGNSEPWKDVEKKVKKLWNFMATAEAMVERESLARFLANTEKKWWQMEDSEKEAALNKLDEISIIHQMIITAYIATEDLTFIDYYLHYDEDDGNIIKEFTEFLNEYGFSYSDNEMYEVMNGTHENYKKEDA